MVFRNAGDPLAWLSELYEDRYLVQNAIEELSILLQLN